MTAVRPSRARLRIDSMQVPPRSERAVHHGRVASGDERRRGQRRHASVRTDMADPPQSPFPAVPHEGRWMTTW